MATPPITMGVQSPNIAQQLLGSVAQGQGIAANRQAMDQSARSSQIQDDEYNYQLGIRKLQVIGRLAQQARQLPQEQRAQFVQSINPQMLQSVGIDPSQASSVPLDDAGLDNYIAQVNSVLPQDQNRANQQFGGQELFKDEAGNLFFATSRRDPVSGQVSGVVAAADGSNTKPKGRLSAAGAYGQTASERVGQIGAEASARTQAEQDVIAQTEPQIQAEITAQKERAKQAEIQRADAIKTGNKYDSLLAGFEEAKAIIPMSTGSTIGSIRDAAGRIVGFSSDAAQNTARLKALGAWLVTQVPKPGGAVSDADLEQFKRAVGEIDNNTPPEERLAAIDTAMTLIQKWNTSGVYNQGGSGKGSNTPGINPNASTSNGWSIRPLGN